MASLPLPTKREHISVAALDKNWPGPTAPDRMRLMAAVEFAKIVYRQQLSCSRSKTLNALRMAKVSASNTSLLLPALPPPPLLPGTSKRQYSKPGCPAGSQEPLQWLSRQASFGRRGPLGPSAACPPYLPPHPSRLRGPGSTPSGKVEPELSFSAIATSGCCRRSSGSSRAGMTVLLRVPRGTGSISRLGPCIPVVALGGCWPVPSGSKSLGNPVPGGL